MKKEIEMYVCPKCNRVWDSLFVKRVTYYFYSEISRYGKEKKLCPECLGKKIHKENL